MKKAKVEVGKVVQVPVYEFAPFRSGWNGWMFQAGIVTGLGVFKKSGKVAVKVEYPSRNYAQKGTGINGKEFECGRTVLEKWFNAECVFDYDLFHCKTVMEHPREYWCKGCYDANTEFLIDKGII